MIERQGKRERTVVVRNSATKKQRASPLLFCFLRLHTLFFLGLTVAMVADSLWKGRECAKQQRLRRGSK